jgi:hypothetical protein
MSGRAVAIRLKRCAQLRTLCISLARAGAQGSLQAGSRKAPAGMKGVDQAPKGSSPRPG